MEKELYVDSSTESISSPVNGPKLIDLAAFTDSGEVTINWVNYSKYEFVLDDWGASGSALAGGLVQSPGPKLQAQMGSQCLDFNQFLSSMSKAKTDIWATWYCKEKQLRIGTRIIAPVQVFSMGPRPYWEILFDNRSSGVPRNWGRSGSNPSQPYTWPAAVGFGITATAQSWHTALAIQVVISDPGK